MEVCWCVKWKSDSLKFLCVLLRKVQLVYASRPLKKIFVFIEAKSVSVYLLYLLVSNTPLLMAFRRRLLEFLVPAASAAHCVTIMLWLCTLVFRMLYTWKYKFDQRHNLLYCPIPKSGWSSWKRVLFYINGVITSMDVEIGITSDRKARIADMSGFAIPRANKTGQFRPFTFAFVR